MNHAITVKNLSRTPEHENAAPGESYVKSVLFVCKCNVCRSPAGKSVLQSYLQKRNLESAFFVDSAGVSLDDVPPLPSFAMRWAAFWRGYRLKKKARRVRRPDLDRFDLVIAMDQENFNALYTINSQPKSTIRLLSDFLSDDSPREVPDPMNRSRRTCDYVFDLLESACPKIVETLTELPRRSNA